jgi:hypothetical protein
MDRALETMANFECKKCTHHGVKAAWPARRQQADCPSPPMRLVCRPCGTIELAKPAPEAAAPPPKQLLAAAPRWQSVVITCSGGRSHESCGSDPPPKPLLALAPPKPQALKGKFAVLSVEGDEQSDADDEEESAAVDDEGTLGRYRTMRDAAPILSIGSVLLALYLWPISTCFVILSVIGLLVFQANRPASKKTGPSKRTQKKKACRARKRERERGGLGVADAAQTAAASAAVVTAATTKPTASMAEQRGCADPYLGCADTSLGCADPEAHEETAAECSGSFALLSYDALIIVMEKLHSEADVRSLACTCSHMRSACSDGLLWRVLFHRHFPASQLARPRSATGATHTCSSTAATPSYSAATTARRRWARSTRSAEGSRSLASLEPPMDLRLACKCSPRRHCSSHRSSASRSRLPSTRARTRWTASIRHSTRSRTRPSG